MSANLTPYQVGIGRARPKHHVQSLKIDLTYTDFINAAQRLIIPTPDALINIGIYGSWKNGNTLLWTDAAAITYQLQDKMTALNMGAIQSVYVDASNNPLGLILRFGGVNGYQINVPAFTQGVYPVLAYEKPLVDIVYVDRATAWTNLLSVDAANNAFIARIQFFDTMLESYSSSVRSSTTGVWNDASGALSNSGKTPLFSQILYTNPWRRGLIIQNHANQVEPLYFTFALSTDYGTIDQAYELKPGDSYVSNNPVETWQPVMFSAATVGHKYVCKELF